MLYFKLKVRQLTEDTFNLDEDDLQRVGLTFNDIKEAEKSKDKLSEISDKLDELVGSVATPIEVLWLKVKDEEFDDDMIKIGAGDVIG